MDDVRAVMDAVGSKRAALLGISEGGAMCAVFAATFPERTRALILYGAYARRLWAPDYPWAPTREEREQFFESLERDWGTDVQLGIRAPGLAGDRAFQAWWTTYLRMSASPGAAVALSRMNMEIYVRQALPAISAPSLVIYRSGDQTITVGNGRYLAEHIRGAKYIELPGDDHLPFVGDQDAILAEIEHFVTGIRPVAEPDQVLATLQAVEIVGAAAIAVQEGDDRWHAIIGAYRSQLDEYLREYRGRQIVQTISGSVCAFDSPVRAIRCAKSMIDTLAAQGIPLRAGLHTGECEVQGERLGGSAMQIATQVVARARVGEVVVSNTVKDLVAGSGILFQELPVHLTTGSDHTWQLYRVQAERSPLHAAGHLIRLPEADSLVRSALSHREREVALLIGQGLSNREIAEAMSISVATVERHVSNIHIKLGFHSRVQIAARTIQQGQTRDA
jgi:DNA-binding CsgD family transcriptional regulator/class 3 adenylate cyclase